MLFKFLCNFAVWNYESVKLYDKIIGNMKKYVVLLVVAMALMSAGKQDGVITKEDGATIVNTTTIAKDVEGYSNN